MADIPSLNFDTVLKHINKNSASNCLTPRPPPPHSHCVNLGVENEKDNYWRKMFFFTLYDTVSFQNQNSRRGKLLWIVDRSAVIKGDCRISLYEI